MAALRSTVPDMLVVTYLQMTKREQFVPAYSDHAGVRVTPIHSPDLDFYRFLYRSVGEGWRWRDRLLMDESDLKAALANPGVSVDVLYVGDKPAGYVELARQGGETEMAYFGLFPAYYGMGLGKHLLSYGIERAWEADTARLWLHTCNLDSPHALDNYLKRGFQIYKLHRYPMPERYQ
jgi:ribosomal protein S18 acetylase RimI-like enzyme